MVGLDKVGIAALALALVTTTAGAQSVGQTPARDSLWNGTLIGLDSSPERFPQAQRVVADLDFSQVDLRPQTFIVVASHGNYDEDALAWALTTPAAYVALVASPRRAEAVHP